MIDDEQLYIYNENAKRNENVLQTPFEVAVLL